MPIVSGRWLRRVSAFATLVVAMVLAMTLVALAGGGRFLVAMDAFEVADVAIVLSGGAAVRVLAARDLYRAGRVHHIVIIPEPPEDPAIERELVALGLRDPAQTSQAERILLASGVPRAAFEFLPAPVDGTVNEARAVRRFLEGRAGTRLAVVTSKFASRRACVIFRWMLEGRKVYCAPSPYDSFTPDGWWRQPRNALAVVMEYQKLVANVAMLVATRP